MSLHEIPAESHQDARLDLVEELFDNARVARAPNR